MKTILISLIAVFAVAASGADAKKPVAQQAPNAAPAPEPVPHDPTMEEKMAETMDGAIKKAKVQILEPKHNAKVGKTFKVKMMVEGLKVRPAGEAPDEVTSGHHHLIIDGKPIEGGHEVISDDKHLHFGKGQTETEVTLPPGKHTLTLQFADGMHRSFGPKMSHTITVNVK
jgi:hypothetical protein